MDAMTPEQLLDVRAQELAQAHAKDALVRIARRAGWTGDPARTSKEGFARWIVERFDAEALTAELARNASRDIDGDPAQMIAKAIQSMLAAMPAQMDEPRVREIAHAAIYEQRAEIIKEAREGIEPREVRIIVSERAEVRIDEHTHPIFDKALRLLSQGVNVFLKGPAGCGKSHLAAQLARAMGRTYGALHCSAGASESQLLGWLLPTGEGGRFEYVPAQFARMFAEGGALFLVDEIDAADPNFLMVLNGALANGHLHVPQNWKQPSVERGANFGVLAAANTYGTGADALYVGRNPLDAATLDRFYVLEMDYDRELERQMAPAEVCEWAWALRDRANAARLRRVISTRTIQRVAAAMAAGISFDEAKRDALTGWTRDELAKVQA